MAIMNEGRSNVVKWLVLATLGVALGLGGCKKAPVAEQPAETPPPATPAPTTPAPSVAATTPPPATPAPKPAPTPELAPPGVYYLLTAVSIETADGILGLKPGQGLREVRPGVYSTGTNEMTLRPEQVTNDMGLARRVMTQDRQAQEAIHQRLSSQAPAATATPGNLQPAASVASTAAAEKEAARNQIFKQIQAIDLNIQQVQTSLNPYTAKYGGAEYAAKKSPQAFTLLQQLNGLYKQRNDMQAKMSAIP